MIAKGFVMIKDDKKIATFHSTLKKNGDIVCIVTCMNYATMFSFTHRTG